MINKHFNVLKGSGDLVPFNEQKLVDSLSRSGAAEHVIHSIFRELEPFLKEGVSTKFIYKKAFELLKRKAKPSAAKYQLKKAIFKLGPTGYPFENLVSEIYKAQGYETVVGTVVQGKCVTHEVDVIAANASNEILIECKFHQDQNRVSDVKVALYIQARFEDIRDNWLKGEHMQNQKISGAIITNTRFTEDAIQYGECRGIKLIGWDYPRGGSLKELIDHNNIHPLTCLTTLTHREQNLLLENDLILCRQLADNSSLLKKFNFSESKIRKVLTEVEDIIY